MAPALTEHQAVRQNSFPHDSWSSSLSGGHRCGNGFGQTVLVFIGDWKQIHNDRKSSVSWHGKNARALAWETDTGTCPLGRGPALLLRDSLWKLTGR